MSGQAAALTIDEARKAQVVIQHPKSQARDTPKSGSHENICTKVKHQG